MEKLIELDREMIKEHQNNDEIMTEVRKWLTKKEPPTKDQLQGQSAEMWFWSKHFEDISVAEDGVLQVQLPEKDAETMRMKIMVPQSLKKRVFEACHEHKSAGHFGVAATMARIRRNFYFYNLSTEVSNRIKICHECVAKVKQKSLKEGTHYSTQPGFPLQLIYIDLIGPMNQTNEGYKYVMSVEDGQSRWISLYPLRTKETQEVTRVLVERFIGQYGCPRSIYSDNGKEFSSQIFQSMCQALGVVKKNSPPYCPQGNKVERVHRTLNAFMRMTLAHEDKQWNRNLPFFTLAYNSKVNSSTGVTPNLAFLGREASLPLDLMTQLPKQGQQTVHQNIREMIDRSQKMFSYIRSMEKAVLRRNANQYGGKRNPYGEGDLIWYFTPRKTEGKPDKITNKWLGPWRVTKRISEVLISITPAGYSGKEYIVHVSRVRQYHGTIDEHKAREIPKNLQMDDEDDPEGTMVHGTHTAGRLELGVPVNTGSAGTPMVDLKDHKKDAVEEENLPMAKLNPVEDKLEESDEEMAQEPETKEDQVMEEPTTGNPSKQQKRKISEEEDRLPETTVKKKLHRRAPRRAHETSDSEPSKSRTSHILKKSARLLENTSSSTSSEEDTSSTEDMMRIAEEQEVKLELEVGAKLPTQKTEQAAGWDLCSNIEEEIEPGEIKVFNTGIKLQMPTCMFAKIEARSSLAVKGIQTLAGVIDADYRGVVRVVLKNLSAKKFVVKQGDRIAQLTFLPNLAVQLKTTQKLDETERGEGGFGSTGRN
jgi:dUTP pyrophosphatase